VASADVYAVPAVVADKVLQNNWNGERERSFKNSEGFGKTTLAASSGPDRGARFSNRTACRRNGRHSLRPDQGFELRRLHRLRVRGDSSRYQDEKVRVRCGREFQNRGIYLPAAASVHVANGSRNGYVVEPASIRPPSEVLKRTMCP
jgi:hypothetical protein